MEKTATFKEVNASGWKGAGSRWGGRGGMSFQPKGVMEEISVKT